MVWLDFSHTTLGAEAEICGTLNYHSQICKEKKRSQAHQRGPSIAMLCVGGQVPQTVESIIYESVRPPRLG